MKTPPLNQTQSVDTSTWSISEPINFQSAAKELKIGITNITQGKHNIDLSALTNPDSSTLAVLLAWLRHAKTRHVTLKLQGFSPKLQQLIDLYDLQEVFKV
jgi:ABC-type transporter Mla MlaB component